MNEAIKLITKKLEEGEIGYQLLENNKSLIMSLYSEKTGLTIKFLISTDEVDDDIYSLTVMTGDLLKVKNEFELLKTLNNINWNKSFICYVVGDEKDVHIKMNSFTTSKSIADDTISFLSEIIDNLEENYDIIMKSNWS